MAKKAVKKESKPMAHHALAKPPKKRYDKHIIYIGILLIIIAVILYAVLNKAPQKDVVAVVNGQDVTQADVDLVAKFSPDNQRETVLNRTIDEALIMQDARKRGIEASAEEINKALQDAIQKSGQTQQEVETSLLRERNITKEDLNALFKKQVILAKLIAQIPELKATVTEQEIKAFYEQNKDQIAAPYEAAKEQIRGYIQNSKLTQAFANYLGRLRAEASIQVVKK